MFVTLTIYDVVGRKVARLISGEMPAGHHSTLWYADGMPSGVYFYRLQAGTYSETKRLLLQK